MYCTVDPLDIIYSHCYSFNCKKTVAVSISRIVKNPFSLMELIIWAFGKDLNQNSQCVYVQCFCKSWLNYSWYPFGTRTLRPNVYSLNSFTPERCNISNPSPGKKILCDTQLECGWPCHTRCIWPQFEFLYRLQKPNISTGLEKCTCCCRLIHKPLNQMENPHLSSAWTGQAIQAPYTNSNGTPRFSLIYSFFP